MSSEVDRSQDSTVTDTVGMTLHGVAGAVAISNNEAPRRDGQEDREALVTAMQASPLREIDIEPKRGPMPVRAIEL